MESIFEWNYTHLLYVFILIMMVVPAVVLYFDDDELHHLH